MLVNVLIVEPKTIQRRLGMNKEVKTADDLRELGWTDWYHPNYWVHPDLSDSSGKIDYTYLGMTLEQAIIYENSGKRK